MVSPSSFLVGTNVEMRPCQLAHIDLYFQWINDAQARHLARNVFPVSRESLKKQLEEDKEDPKSVWMEIWHKKDQKPVGTGGLFSIDLVNRHAVIVMSIGEVDYWHKGIGTEVYKILINYGFGELNLHRIEAWIYDPNDASKQAAHKAGMDLECSLNDTIFIDGSYYCTDIFVIFESAWRSSRENEITTGNSV